MTIPEEAIHPIEHIRDSSGERDDYDRLRTMCGKWVLAGHIAPGLIDATCKNCLRSIPKLRRNVDRNSRALELR